MTKGDPPPPQAVTIVNPTPTPPPLAVTIGITHQGVTRQWPSVDCPHPPYLGSDHHTPASSVDLQAVTITHPGSDHHTPASSVITTSSDPYTPRQWSPHTQAVITTPSILSGPPPPAVILSPPPPPHTPIPKQWPPHTGHRLPPRPLRLTRGSIRWGGGGGGGWVRAVVDAWSTLQWPSSS